MTIYHAHGKYFLPLHDGIREVSYMQICEWEKHGMQIEILEESIFD